MSNATFFINDTTAESTFLSDSQTNTLSLLSFFSAILSTMGSATICAKILRNRQVAGPYDRLMLGLSICDMWASLTYGLFAPLLVPSKLHQGEGDDPSRPWAMGNDATCSFLGFGIQFAFSAMAYNALLSGYYLVTVRFSCNNVNSKDRKAFFEMWERPVHFLVWIFFLGTAIGGAGIGLYSEFELTQGCWIGDYPSGCDISGSSTPCSGQYIGWVFGGLPTLLAFGTIITNNLLIYCRVRKTLTHANQQVQEMEDDDSCFDEYHVALAGDGSSSNCEEGWTDRHFGRPEQHSHDDDSNSDDEKDWDEKHDRNRPRQQPESNITDNRMAIRHAHIQEVASQGVLYVLTFLLSYTPQFALRVLESMQYKREDEVQLYPLLVINAWLFPLQGFFNLFVYVKPSYIRFRQAFPNAPKWYVLQKACFDSKIPKLSATTTMVAVSKRRTWGGKSKRTMGRGSGRTTRSNHNGSSNNTQSSNNRNSKKNATRSDGSNSNRNRNSDGSNNRNKNLISPHQSAASGSSRFVSSVVSHVSLPPVEEETSAELRKQDSSSRRQFVEQTVPLSSVSKRASPPPSSPSKSSKKKKKKKTRKSSHHGQREDQQHSQNNNKEPQDSELAQAHSSPSSASRKSKSTSKNKGEEDRGTKPKSNRTRKGRSSPKRERRVIRNMMEEDDGDDGSVSYDHRILQQHFSDNRVSDYARRKPTASTISSNALSPTSYSSTGSMTASPHSLSSSGILSPPHQVNWSPAKDEDEHSMEAHRSPAHPSPRSRKSSNLSSPVVKRLSMDGGIFVSPSTSTYSQEQEHSS